MREVVVGETKVLLIHLKGKFYAIGGECTHYGGPLAEGALSGHRVVCPWHQAVFDATNGDLKEPPALDAEPCYTVRVEGDDVIVKVPEKPANRRTPAMVRRDPPMTAPSQSWGWPGQCRRKACARMASQAAS
jgi:nitrite reductase/ring-hydroxylating ferredoxin subunit